MDVWFAPVGPDRHRAVLVTVDGRRHDTELPSRSYLLHDLAHYAYEAAVGAEDGFFELVGRGAVDPMHLREHGVDPGVWAGLMEVEKRVVRLQTAFKAGDAADLPGGPELRALVGAWRKVRFGQALHLRWPDATPTVVDGCG